MNKWHTNLECHGWIKQDIALLHYGNSKNFTCYPNKRLCLKCDLTAAKQLRKSLMCSQSKNNRFFFFMFHCERRIKTQELILRNEWADEVMEDASMKM